MTVYINLDNMTDEEAWNALVDLIEADKTRPTWQQDLITRHKEWGLDSKVVDSAELEKLVNRIRRRGD